jgi:hypothetical protein
MQRTLKSSYQSPMMRFAMCKEQQHKSIFPLCRVVYCLACAGPLFASRPLLCHFYDWLIDMITFPNIKGRMMKQKTFSWTVFFLKSLFPRRLKTSGLFSFLENLTSLELVFALSEFSRLMQFFQLHEVDCHMKSIIQARILSHRHDQARGRPFDK